ncbi:hypothetical protein EDF28_3574 [Curtobacterium sp. PhB137]|uniref:hypothetical protein n=1 Tax=Curtobacterium sp. PhB137 TaxID=2485182 RepID=UPI000F5025B2|nr:hypothetical protein [Curtobacterium sp. PhB137]RPE75629.1 hypothetical protein EDF28_3574 [Curtobacterium sp. PhB137]
MTVSIYIPSTLSAGARQALTDMLSGTTEVTSLVDTEQGLWTVSDAEAVAVELEQAGYGVRSRTGAFAWTIEPHSPPNLGTDFLDDITPALAIVEQIMADTNAVRTPKNPGVVDNDAGFGSYGLLIGVLNILQLADHDLRGDLQARPASVQFPMVAQVLARHIRREAGQL